MKSQVAVLFVVFCIGSALFFLRNGADPELHKKPANEPIAVPRAAPFGAKIVTPDKKKPTVTTPSPTPSAEALQNARQYDDPHIGRM